MNKLKFFLLFLFFDLFISSVFFKNTSFWKIPEWEEKYWRVPSKIYHHAIMPNIDVVEKWGGQISKRVITNSVGFFDKEKRNILKTNPSKKRILLIGDSFIEGSGLNYEDTVAGLLNDYLGENYEILNSALGSYSPSIYFKKTEHYIKKGYEFDQALVFLDVSDIFDELFIKFDEKGNILTYKQTKKRGILKQNFYALGNFLRENTITFRLLNITSDKFEHIKNYIKLKFKTAKNLEKKFFDVTRDEVMFYRMTHIDRGYWTFNTKTFSNIKEGLAQSEKYLTKLFDLFKKKNISATLIVYPWPTQIVYGDSYHENHWKKFSESKNINFLSMYNNFKSNDNQNFIFDNFLYGDIHWNKNGTKIIFNNIIKNINF